MYTNFTSGHDKIYRILPGLAAKDIVQGQNLLNKKQATMLVIFCDKSTKNIPPRITDASA